MTPNAFIDAINTNPINAEILARLPSLGLDDVWLVSGALFQTVWNHATGRDPQYGIKDYDIFYYDTDTSWEAEDRIIKHADDLFAGLGAQVELRNQARVQLWYEEKFGLPYPALANAREGLDNFLAIACMIGVQPQDDNTNAPPRVYAPKGLDDMANLIVRPNPCANFQSARYEEKAQRWKTAWPELTILPASDDKAP